MIKTHHYFFAFVLAILLLASGAQLFSEGMFADGLLYAAISNNLSLGLGTFWHPHSSNYVFNVFHEHPPLALGLQSFWFKAFGSSIYVERLYALTTYLLSTSLIIAIWKQLTNETKHAWIPLLFWVTIGIVPWALANNMLENTMTVFMLAAVWCYFKNLKSPSLLLVIASGLFLFLALITKGFFCLYLWGLPLFFWFFTRKVSFRKSVLDTALLIGFTLLPIVTLFVFVSDAQENFTAYFNNQVMGSINNVQTVDSRFAIVNMFFQNALIPIFIGAIVLIVAWRKKVSKSTFVQNKNTLFAFWTLVFGGILPIMISLKQSDFYILSVFPLFSLGWAYYLYPFLKKPLFNLNPKSLGFIAFKGITFLMLLGALIICFKQIGKVGRDVNKINDTKAIISVVGTEANLNLCPNLHREWSLHAYFARYGQVSLDTNQAHLHAYLVSTENCAILNTTPIFEKIELSTNQYHLYKRK